MHKITALTLQKRNRQRVNVYLDGEFAFGLSRIVSAWLRVGQEISDEKIAQLQSDDAVEVAYQRALRLLNYRPRSESEIRTNLKKHRVDEGVIVDALERLRQDGFVDDVRFAKIWVENRCEMRPRGKRALVYELRQRGVDPEIIDNALVEIDEEKLALAAAKKKAHKLSSLEWDDFRQKMFGFLARRGFTYEICVPAVAQVWAEEHDHAASEEAI